MKTDEMNDKIDAIDINAISKKIPEDCKILVIKVKDKLAEFFLNADFFKQVQEEASDIEKPFKKSGKIVGADKFNNFYKYIPLSEKFQAKSESDNIKKLLEYFKEYGEKAVQEQKRNEIKCTYEERSIFFENVEKLEKECREAKQEFKDKFEKVYKSLKSFIKKLEKVKKANEKGTGQKGIEEVLTSEIIDFKKYGIDLDKIIQKIKKQEKV